MSKFIVKKFAILNLVVFPLISVAVLFACSDTSTSSPDPTGSIKTNTSVPFETTTLQDGFVAVTLAVTSTARYKIRERLARLELPNDAIGQTKKVSGNIIFDAQGSIQDSSQFTVNVESLVSDESKRDRYVRNNTLNTGIYPEIYFK